VSDSQRDLSDFFCFARASIFGASLDLHNPDRRAVTAVFRCDDAVGPDYSGIYSAVVGAYGAGKGHWAGGAWPVKPSKQTRLAHRLRWTPSLYWPPDSLMVANHYFLRVFTPATSSSRVRRSCADRLMNLDTLVF
jgi:hypothetical protein